MTSLIDQLFAKSQAKSVKSLLEDHESRYIVQQEVGKIILEKDQILDQSPLSQIIFIVSLSPFANESECDDVAEIIRWGVGKNDIIPMITEHRGKDLAYRCFISLSFFSEYMVLRCERHGAPSPKFYRGIGVQSFKKIGMEDIGNNFEKWETFLKEIFV